MTLSECTTQSVTIKTEYLLQVTLRPLNVAEDFIHKQELILRQCASWKTRLMIQLLNMLK